MRNFREIRSFDIGSIIVVGCAALQFPHAVIKESIRNNKWCQKAYRSRDLAVLSVRNITHFQMQPSGRSTQSLHTVQRTRYGPKWKIDLRLRCGRGTRRIACSSDGEAAQKVRNTFKLRPVCVRVTICGKERKDTRWMS